MPWIAFLKSRAGGKLSDIEFLAIKEFGSKRVDVDDSLSSALTGEKDLAVATAASGKDMYLASASFSFAKSSATADDVFMRLYINGTQIEEITYQNLPQVPPGNNWQYEFKTKGVKVAATQIIKITKEQVTTNNINFESKLVLFEEATGATPQVTSI